MRPPSGEDSKHDHVLHLAVPGAEASAGAETPLRFVESGGHPQILAPTNPLPQWARALSGNRGVFWRIGRKEFTGRAVPIVESEASGVVNRFEAEFGPDRVRRWFGPTVQAFELQPLTPRRVTYRDSVESYFDAIASYYDASVARNPFDLELRHTSVETLLRTFRPGDRVLELGCGTGLETLAIASRGISVLATDISGEMIRLLKGKVDDGGLSRFVEARRMAAGDVEFLVDEYGRGSFDGAFSTFGALNCEESLEPIPSVLYELLRPRGAVMFGIWNRYCMSELALSLAGGHPRRAFARRRTPVPVGLSRYGIPVHARSFRSFVHPFLPYFQVEHVVGLPVFVPPYDYGASIRARRGLHSLLRGLDKGFAGHFPFNRLGDHFLVEMRRRQ